MAAVGIGGRLGLGGRHGRGPGHRGDRSLHGSSCAKKRRGRPGGPPGRVQKYSV
ncbi:hypothetical protein CC56_3568 [Bordetella pertussis H934]|nr:hypothetical protein CC56_3568 [Bordetella pertussis H934]